MTRNQVGGSRGAARPSDASEGRGAAQRAAAAQDHERPVLEVDDACVTFSRRGAEPVHAVDHISLSMAPGSIVGLVGESGSGKSTLAKCIVGMQPLDSGSIRVNGMDVRQVAKLRGHERAGVVQMVFQDPYSSLNPRMKVGEAIGEVLDTYEDLDGAQRRSSVNELLDLVRLPAGIGDEYPSQLSGGMRQRIAVARCLAARPSLIVADEITSALDVSVQAVVLNLISSLHRELGFSMLFISHNFAAVRYISEDILVMHTGRIVERGNAEAIVRHPRDPYTRSLVSAIPSLDDAGRDVLYDPQWVAKQRRAVDGGEVR